MIEFEIVNPQDWTMILNYLCGLFILFYIFVIFMGTVRQKNCDHRDKMENINYDAVLFSIDKTERKIVFVDNIKQAETLVEYTNLR